jgi:4-amino-4-deoxy-L-arabinose transferase-like glycosyltransferase
MTLTRYNLSFFALIIFHTLVLLYNADNFSISYKEALIYFGEFNTLNFITNLSTSLFGQNDIALRLPFIVFYILSVILLYNLTENYFKKEEDRLITISIFMMLPGVNSGALLVNESIIVVFCTLFYLYLYKIRKKEHYLLLFLFLFIDNSFAILYLALFFYSLKKKDNLLLTMSLIFFGLSMSMYGFDIAGRPRGYFLDTFGIYATIFSPLLFLYFFYSMYRVGIKGEKYLFWYISMTALVLSLIFSLRQRISIEDFAPFVVIAIPIMVKLFLNSYRVRLREFRRNHRIFLTIVISGLVLNFFTLLGNKYLYLLLEDSKEHFAYKYHIAKELAEKLKENNINEIFTKDNKMALRLKYYGIGDSTKYYLSSNEVKSSYKKIDINYNGKTVASYNVISIK